jgi:gas vesicle protein
MSDTKTRTLFAVLGAMALLLAAPALGAEQTRESYTEAVEPICKSNAEASDRILDGVKQEVRQGKLKVAAAKFTKAAAALKQTLRQLKAVPKPTTDAAKLDKWLGFIKNEVELFERTAKKLKAGDKIGAQTMAVRLTSTANKANNQVLTFEFKYCRVDPSQFT